MSTMTFEPVDLSDLTVEKLTQDLARQTPSVDAEGVEFGYAGGYFIAADRIDTPVKLLGWVAHLSTKNWMREPERMRLFVEAVAGYHGWRLHPV